ncbi:MAG TPA: gamma-glutamyltransferase [Nocardioides sp.]|uniref:gamma-glutamyltransferase family protein n=1 Tax=Nocardioides sp. TaxID=35761 RepID=UPI002E317BCF|nr:gamma-glutamyltransferase [Nocardioides sp.]HEX5088045.1 gamma-glutamyltransferase [Nocardioides sp.]
MTDLRTRPTLRGSFGMVASTHWLASQSAMAELEAGGNAFDAAVAGAFVLHVVEPHLNGPAGEVPAVFATAGDPNPHVLCGQGTAPAGATREHHLSLGLDLVPGTGLLAAAVPGAVDAWLMLARDHGTRGIRDLLSYAIGYARHGHPILPAAAETIQRVEQLFREHWPTSAARWLPVPRPWQPVTNHEHAATLERLVAEGEAAGSGREAQYDGARRAWREGFVAEAVDAFVQRPVRDSSGADHAGVLTGADLAGWSASYEAPVRHRYRDVEVAKTDLWGQGPVLLQSLAMLEGLPADPTEPDGIHTIVEVLKLALADRDAWYGDGSPVSVGELLDPAYVEARRALVGDRASFEPRPGAPGGRMPVLPSHVLSGTSAAAGAGLGEPAVEWGDTCHLDVVDRWGNIISATPSGGWLQSSPTIPELGFCLGTRLQMTWLDEGLPATLTPGRRPRTTLSPTLVLRDGVPVLACGTPGGDQQDQWQLPFLLHHLVHGRELQEAVEAPAFHTTSMVSSFYPRETHPGELVVEDRVGARVIAALTARGHRVVRAGEWTLGRLSAVGRDPDTGTLTGAATSRGGNGYAVGR